MSQSGKPKVAVINNLARAGGTLINRCIGSMQGVMMFSEIHPGINKERMLEQAEQWFDLSPDIDSKDDLDFLQVFDSVLQECLLKKQSLVLRDWSHVDFMAQPFVGFPVNRNVLIETLSESYDVRSVAIIRHPIDQWLSMHKLVIFKQNPLPVAHFLNGYMSFMKQCCSDGFIRYEDITAEPNKMFAEICERIEINYDPGYWQKWSNYDYVTGDVWNAGRANSDTEITSLPRVPVERETLNRFLVQAEFRELLKITGYSI